MQFYSNSKFFIIICQLLISISCVNGNPHNYNCTSIIIGYGIQSMDLIKNCTVIRGSLVIKTIDFSAEELPNGDELEVTDNETIEKLNSDVKSYTLVNLREITEYLIVYNISGLSSLATILPNLTIIRGKKLFHNYALSIYEVSDLVEIGLKSLLEIQRGHVFVDICPDLCNLDNILWNRLTTSLGSNYIQPSNVTECPLCEGCAYCWDSKHCQRFKGYDIINGMEHNANCHPQCFGGCFKAKSNEECNVCSNYRENKACVERCSLNYYAYHYHMHCYTRDECVNVKHGGLLYHGSVQNECLHDCPYGYRPSNESICIHCEKKDDPRCVVECGTHHDKVLEVTSLDTMEGFRGCHIVNNSISIRLLDLINDAEMKTIFGEIRVIRGFLKVFDSPYLKNLKFFKNLREVQANKLFYTGEYEKNEHFAILIHQNRNLTQVWELSMMKNLSIGRGGLFVDSNPKLCTWEIHMMQQVVHHDQKNDFIFLNDEELFCKNASFKLQIKTISPNSLHVNWTEFVPFQRTELVPFQRTDILYREVPSNTNRIDLDEDLQNDVCLRTSWIKVELLNYKLQYYNITNLKENTNYAVIVKQFHSKSREAAFQSETTFKRTPPDLPAQPRVGTKVKTYSSIILVWDMKPYRNHNLTNIRIEIYKLPENKTELDTRDYCEQIPIYYNARPASYENDMNQTDDCVRKRRLTAQQQEDEEFANAMKHKFRCSVNNLANCDGMNRANTTKDLSDEQVVRMPPNQRNYVRKIDYDPKNTDLVIMDLKHATLYAFKVFFCNKYSCGNYAMHYDVTERIQDANDIGNIKILRTLTQQNTYNYSIKFEEPPFPNGVILSYRVFFARNYTSNLSLNDSRFYCFSTMEMKRRNYTIDYDPTYNFSISVISTWDIGTWSLLRGKDDFTTITEIDDNEAMYAEILVPLLVGILLCLGSWYAYRKYPQIRSSIYYNVQSDQVNLMDDDGNDLYRIAEESEDALEDELRSHIRQQFNVY